MNVKLFLAHVCPPFPNVMHIYATRKNYSFSVFVFIVAVSVYLKLKNASTSPIPVDVDMSSHVISQCRQNRFCIHKDTPLCTTIVRKGDRPAAFNTLSQGKG